MTFQPELQRQQEEREGVFQERHHEQNENAISQAMLSDFQEAKQQAMDTSKKGPAWKLRQMLFGKHTDQPANEEPSTITAALKPGNDEAPKEG